MIQLGGGDVPLFEQTSINRSSPEAAQTAHGPGTMWQRSPTHSAVGLESGLHGRGEGYAEEDGLSVIGHFWAGPGFV